MTIISSHGFKFNVEADGFVRANAEQDRDNGIAAIEAHLDQMDARTVSAMHFADLAWQERDCAGNRPSLIDEIESIGHSAATAGWHNPSAVSLMVSAAR